MVEIVELPDSPPQSEPPSSAPSVVDASGPPEASPQKKAPPPAVDSSTGATAVEGGEGTLPPDKPTPEPQQTAAPPAVDSGTVATAVGGGEGTLSPDKPPPEPQQTALPPALDKGTGATAVEGREGTLPPEKSEVSAAGDGAGGSEKPVEELPQEIVEVGPTPEEIAAAHEARMLELIETAKEEIKDLKSENFELQRRVWAMQKKRPSQNLEQFILEGQDAHYQARLNAWAETKIAFDRLKEEYDHRIDTLRESLRKKQDEAKDHHEKMISYIWKVAKESEDSISEKRIPARMLKKREQEERDTTMEMEAVRIRGRQLRSQLKKLEHALEMKDQLPGGLHLVDFEQLKMGNESLNEKIHEKNEDLTNLRKKTTTLVHTLTHVREKLQFVVQETKDDAEALAADDKERHSGRMELCEIKARCEAIRRRKENMQKNVVNISNPALLEDMEIHKEDVEVAEESIQELQSRYNTLHRHILRNSPLLSPKAHSPRAPLKPKSADVSRSMSPPVEEDPLRWGTKLRMVGKVQSDLQPIGLQSE